VPKKLAAPGGVLPATAAARLTYDNRVSFIIRHLIAAKAIQYLTG
jgi:hypothetical protein